MQWQNSLHEKGLGQEARVGRGWKGGVLNSVLQQESQLYCSET